MPDIILWDVMSTLVYDPYMTEFPAFFNTTWPELLKVKHPTAWVDFELGRITEQEFFAIFWPEFGDVNLDDFHQMLFDAYRYLPGIQTLLEDLSTQNLQMHTLSNYPVWYTIIEQKLNLSRFMDWSFVSCHMQVRKPDPLIYQRAADALGVSPERCIFVDDRGSNCKAAKAVGMHTVKFSDADQLRQDIFSLIESR